MPVESAILLGVHLAGFALWAGFLAGFLIIGYHAVSLLRACLLVMPVTLISGWALAFALYGAPGNWPWAINAMQTTGLAMAVILLVAWFGGMLLLRDAEGRRDADLIATASRRLNRLAAVDLALAGLALAFAVTGYYG